MKVPGHCGCSTPIREVIDGLVICQSCGEPIADPLLVRVLAEILALRRQVAELEQKLTEPKRPAPEWLAAKEVAQRLGRSTDFVYSHADQLGAKRVGSGPKPRLFFPRDAG